MKASDLFVKALEAEGVRCVFGLPGEENLDMLESLRASGIPGRSPSRPASRATSRSSMSWG